MEEHFPLAMTGSSTWRWADTAFPLGVFSLFVVLLLGSGHLSELDLLAMSLGPREPHRQENVALGPLCQNTKQGKLLVADNRGWLLR